VVPVQVSADELTTVLCRLLRGAAGGPSGWTYEHNLAATSADAATFQAVLAFVNLVVSGDLPDVAELLNPALIGLQNSGGRGLRPIAIGEAWYQLAALCALECCPDTGASLAPLQLGVVVPSGNQVVAHAAVADFAADAGMGPREHGPSERVPPG
jgi:hypothetical protein